MTLGLSLSIGLGAGLYIDAGPTVLKQRFAAAWGGADLSTSNTISWDLNRVHAWQHTAPWMLRFAKTHSAVYGLRVEASHQHPYADMRVHRLSEQAPWGQLHLSKVHHQLVYTDLALLRKAMRTPYWMLQTAAARSVLGYAVSEVEPVARRLLAPWSVLADVRLQALADQPEIVWNGQTVRIVSATISCDEDSPVWMARIEIALLADFAGIGIGDPITMALGVETFAMVVDGKTLSRTSVAEQRMELTAVSPLALLDAPFAGEIRYYEAGAVLASAAVEHLIGAIDWQLPDWIIPAGRLMIDGATPLASARNIVSAIGGIVESNPDGSVVCRRRHPVRVPDYASASVAHGLFDAEVMSSQSSIAPARGFNRVTLSNEDGSAASSSDQIEFVADPNDANHGTVRAYLGAERAVVLAHTGHPDTVIASLGTITRSETETVEFIEGQASTRYSVASIVSALWQHADLGAVTATGDKLASAVPGYSLLRITYATTSLDWRVALAADEEVQFVLVDA